MFRGISHLETANILTQPATWVQTAQVMLATHAVARPFNRYTHGGQLVVERKTISIMKACELVGVSRRTIYNWLSSGKIEYVRTAGGSVRIFVDTLVARSATGPIARRSSRCGRPEERKPA